MVATLASKKKEKDENKQSTNKTNNFGKFFLTLFYHLLSICIVIFFGSNFKFAIDNYGLSSNSYSSTPSVNGKSPINGRLPFKDPLPTNIEKEPYKQTGNKKPSLFYRKSTGNGIFDDIRNWSSKTLIYSWSTSRSFIKSVLDSLKPDATDKSFVAKIYEFGLIFLGFWGIMIGAFLLFIIGSLLPIIGGINSVAGTCSNDNSGWVTSLMAKFSKKPKKFCREGWIGLFISIFLKIVAFFTSLYVFTPVVGSLQSLYFIWKIAFTPIFNSPGGYYKGILQKYKHFIFVLFLVSILSSAWASLNNLTATGITIGAVLSAMKWLYSTYG